MKRLARANLGRPKGTGAIRIYFRTHGPFVPMCPSHA